MQRLGRYGRMTTVVGLVLVAGGTWLWRSTAEGRMMAVDPPAYSAISEFEHDAISNLMADLSLDRDALVALNPSSAQAESIVGAVRDWYEENASTLTTLKTTIDEKVVALRQIEKAIRMGPANPSHDSQLAVARSDLATARAAYRSALEGLERSVESELSDSQETTWAAIKTGWGQQMPIRMLALTDAQRMAVSKAHRTYRRQRAAASTANERSTAQSTWESALNQILAQSQKDVVEAYLGNYATASEAVTDAVHTVLDVEG